jgi:hypothetical protein
LPEFLFNVLRSDIGRWIAFIAVVIRLFFAPYFPNLIHGNSQSPGVERGCEKVLACVLIKIERDS